MAKKNTIQLKRNAQLEEIKKYSDHHKPLKPFSLALLTGALLLGQPAKANEDNLTQLPKIEASNSQTKSIILPLVVAEKWKAKDAGQVLNAEQYRQQVQDQVVLEYGLQEYQQKEYQNGSASIKLEVFEMRYATGAYGLKTYLQSKVSSSVQLIQTKRFLFLLQSKNDNETVPSSFIEGLKFIVVESKNQPPPIVKHLPVTGKVPNSEKYIVGPKTLVEQKHFGFLENGVDFQSGTEAVYGEYLIEQNPTHLLLIEYHTPQLAADGVDRLTQTISAIPDESLKKQTSLKRIGNYAVVTISNTPGKALEALLSEIKYTVTIYWEGDKYTSVPLEYRSQDAAYYEASQTALILLRTFYWIGAMLLVAIVFGLGTGSGFFYWRKYKRANQVSNAFYNAETDTIRLNLEDENSNKEKWPKAL